jgi:hypothetical protein
MVFSVTTRRFATSFTVSSINATVDTIMSYAGQKWTKYTGGYDLSRLFSAFSGTFCAAMTGFTVGKALAGLALVLLVSSSCP